MQYVLSLFKKDLLHCKQSQITFLGTNIAYMYPNNKKKGPIDGSGVSQ